MRFGSSFPCQATKARARLCCGGLVLIAAGLHAQSTASSTPKLTELSLEELMQLEVTTVSKHAEKLTNAPAAVFALTADDVQRSGAPTLPEALRLVPGLQVARVNAHDWAISARGFGDVFANKLLVLRDGRSVYTPLFSGVFWEVQDTMLEDVERIEVVRGPGATLWGANAVNGVINILSKPAAETQGLLTAAAAGSDPEASVAARYGGRVDANTHYRVFGKYTDFAASDLPAGAGDAQDRTKLGLAGFRFDHTNGAGALLTVQGDGYAGRERQAYLVPASRAPFISAIEGDEKVSGANTLARWTQSLPGGGELMSQAYVDYTDRKTPVFDEVRRTFDFELQDRVPVGRVQTLTAGIGLRRTEDAARNTDVITLSPAKEHTDLFSAFVQDDIVLNPNRWHAILGTKLEHNDYTGMEIQPGARLLWTPSDRHTGWLSVARAVRTPSRAEEDIELREITKTPGVSLDIHGNRSFDSEDLIAYEAGYRMRIREKFSVDVATFYNRYTHLRTTEVEPSALPLLFRLANPALPPIAPPVVLPLRASNLLHGETHGGELAFNAQLAPDWRVRTSYALLETNMHRDPGSTDTTTGAALAGNSPRHQASFWSQHVFGRGAWQFDWIVRYVDRLPYIAIPAVWQLDARLAWHPADRWELSLAGRNLLDRSHPEFRPALVVTPVTEVPRSVYVKVKYGY